MKTHRGRRALVVAGLLALAMAIGGGAESCGSVSAGGGGAGAGGGGAADTPGKAPKPAHPGESTSQEQARGSAEDYLTTAHFSRKGLIEQLKFEGFSQADAEYAVNAVHPNWNEQAAGAAKDYLDTSHFSHSGLVEQLEYEGYTPAQAEHGVSAAGL